MAILDSLSTNVSPLLLPLSKKQKAGVFVSTVEFDLTTRSGILSRHRPSHLERHSQLDIEQVQCLSGLVLGEKIAPSSLFRVRRTDCQVYGESFAI